MGETRYPLGENDSVRFGYDDYRYSCLCTFPYNYSDQKLGLSTVESFALLGAALCMYKNGGLVSNDYGDEYVVPDCLPLWVRNEIRRVIGNYPEEYETTHMIPITSEVSEEELFEINLKRIIEWAETELKELKNNK